MSILTIIITCVAIAGIIWVYPKLPYPANLILVTIVAIACVIVLLNLAGVNTGIHA